jgi:hypothetical protein
MELQFKAAANELSPEMLESIQAHCDEEGIGELLGIECEYCERNEDGLIDYIEPTCLYITDKGKYDADAFDGVTEIE